MKNKKWKKNEIKPKNGKNPSRVRRGINQMKRSLEIQTASARPLRDPNSKKRPDADCIRNQECCIFSSEPFSRSVPVR